VLELFETWRDSAPEAGRWRTGLSSAGVVRRMVVGPTGAEFRRHEMSAGFLEGDFDRPAMTKQARISTDGREIGSQEACG